MFATAQCGTSSSKHLGSETALSSLTKTAASGAASSNAHSIYNTATDYAFNAQL
jgi:hypothetical protein